MRGNHMIALARPLMRELAGSMRSAVMLAEAGRERMVRLRTGQGDDSLPMKLTGGTRMRTAPAAQPGDVLERHLAHLEHACEPDNWPKSRTGIVRARQDRETCSFCFSLRDWSAEMFAIGVPLASADGSRILAFRCSGRISIMMREN